MNITTLTTLNRSGMLSNSGLKTLNTARHGYFIFINEDGCISQQ